MPSHGCMSRKITHPQPELQAPTVAWCQPQRERNTDIKTDLWILDDAEVLLGLYEKMRKIHVHKVYVRDCVSAHEDVYVKVHNILRICTYTCTYMDMCLT